MMGKKIDGGIEYEYPIEIIKRYRASSTKWKLEWLEEVNKLTNEVLSKKERILRDRIRKGLI